MKLSCSNLPPFFYWTTKHDINIILSTFTNGSDVSLLKNNKIFIMHHNTSWTEHFKMFCMYINITGSCKNMQSEVSHSN